MHRDGTGIRLAQISLGLRQLGKNLMATINGRRVRIKDCDGIEQVGIVSGWREESDWVIVTNAKGEHFQVHHTEPMEYLAGSDRASMYPSLETVGNRPEEGDDDVVSEE